MERDKRLGPIGARLLPAKLTLELDNLTVSFVGRADLGAALPGCGEFATITGAAPLDQVRAVEPLAPQDGTDLARCERSPRNADSGTSRQET